MPLDTPDKPELFSERLIRLRRETGLSASAAARKAKIPLQSLRRWELGQVHPTYRSYPALASVAHVYGVSFNYLFYGSDPCSPRCESKLNGLPSDLRDILARMSPRDIQMLIMIARRLAEN